ncbi:MAG: hypothetical protein ACREYE_21950 [Gammaproteobacteria bacterium]
MRFVAYYPEHPRSRDLGLCSCEQPPFNDAVSFTDVETATSARAQNDHITDFALGLIAGGLLGGPGWG